MPSLQTRALILRHMPEREHDRVLNVLTPEHGQLRVRARGTKKSVSKLGGSLEPLMEVELMLANGRAVDVVTGSVIRDRFPALRDDVVKLVAAQWLLELVEHVTKPNQSSHHVYDLTIRSLHQLGAVPTKAGSIWLASLRSAWELLVHEGFAPNPDVCAVCHNPIGDTDVAFDPLHGFTHASEADPELIRMTASAMHFLMSGNWPEDVRGTFRQIHPLIEKLVHTTLDKPLRSERVLQRVIRQAQLSARH